MDDHLSSHVVAYTIKRIIGLLAEHHCLKDRRRPLAADRVYPLHMSP